MRHALVRCFRTASARAVHATFNGKCQRVGNFNGGDNFDGRRRTAFQLRRFLGEQCRFHFGAILSRIRCHRQSSIRFCFGPLSGHAHGDVTLYTLGRKLRI